MSKAATYGKTSVSLQSPDVQAKPKGKTRVTKKEALFSAGSEPKLSEDFVIGALLYSLFASSQNGMVSEMISVSDLHR